MRGFLLFATVSSRSGRNWQSTRNRKSARNGKRRNWEWTDVVGVDVVVDSRWSQCTVTGGFLNHWRNGDGFRVGVAARLDGLFWFLLSDLVRSGRCALLLRCWIVYCFRSGRLLLRLTGVERHR